MDKEKNNSEVKEKDPSEYLPSVQFKGTERTTWAVKTSDGSKTIFEISGYGLEINLNRDLLRSIDDVEDMLEGLKELFRKLIMRDVFEQPNENS